jgi:hypothetical protein
MPGTQPDHHGHAVIELSGELGITAAAALGAALSAAVAAVPDVTVDLVPRRPWDSPPAPLPFWTMTWVV